MEANINLMVLKCLDGLHYSFEQLEHSYIKLDECCASIKQDKTKLVSALSYAWSFVDDLHRIREIAQAVPTLSGKNANLKRFLRATSLAEEYRHYIQHLRNELLKKEPNPFPVWGSLSWVDPVDASITHIAVIGTQLEGTGYSGCVYDTHKKQWVSRVCLGVNNKSFNFDPIFKASLDFKKFIMPWILDGHASAVNVKHEIPIISMKLVFGSENAQQKNLADS